MDASATFVLQLRQNLLTYLPSLLIGFLIWCIWCISLSLSSSFVSHALSKVANGSGIPQMKVLLSGHGTTSISSDVLSYKTLVAKAVGTVLAIGSGLSVGKEGPFVHIMSIVAHKLGQIECFKQRENTVVFIRAGTDIIQMLNIIFKKEFNRSSSRCHSCFWNPIRRRPVLD